MNIIITNIYIISTAIHLFKFYYNKYKFCIYNYMKFFTVNSDTTFKTHTITCILYNIL